MEKIIRSLLKMELTNEELGEVLKMCFAYVDEEKLETENKELKAFFLVNFKKKLDYMIYDRNRKKAKKEEKANEN